LQSLHYGAKIAREELHLQELGISTLTACFVNSNRDPKKGEAAKPSDFFYFNLQEDAINISASAANAFFSLADAGLLPNWAVALAPIEKLVSARNHHAPPALRAIISDSLVIICPHVDGEIIRGALAFTNEFLPDVSTLKNPDTDEILTIITKNIAASSWILQPEFTAFVSEA
jgi:hypothetical protein